MEPLSRRLDDLIRAVESAFDGVGREDGVGLREAQVIDAYGTEAERLDARRRDAEARWQDIADADLERRAGALAFLDPKGWRFHIPAYLRWALRFYERPASIPVDAVIYALAPGTAPELKARALERYKTLTGNQAAVVCRFLRFLCEAAGEERCDVVVAREALAYWGRFCT